MASTPGILTNTDAWLAKIYRLMRMQVSASIANVRSAIQFTIGDGQPLTPTNGTTTYTNSVIENKSITFLVNGYGTLVEGVDYSFNSTAGLITLLSGRLFNTGEVYTILY